MATVVILITFIIVVVLAFVILVPVWFIAERWFEQHSQRVLDHMIWREPSGPWDL